MGENTNIAWADHTFNPWVGCQRVSQGCVNCYAEAFNHRVGKDHRWGPRGSRDRTSTGNWAKPRRWDRMAEVSSVRYRVFCASMADVFEDHPDCNAIRPDLWTLVRECPNLDWLILTKRPENIAAMLPDDWGTGYPNVWLGTSIEDMRVADRADALRAIPAVVRFVSYEPALGSLDGMPLHGLDWIIYGGESGPKFRPDDREWARQMRDRCNAEGVAFFYKQGAARFPGTDDLLDGERLQAWPVSARFPGEGA